MNIITIAEIKRRGLSAVEEALAQGPVYLLKRNRPAAVLLSERDYARLTAAAGGEPTARNPSALDVFLADQPAGTLNAAGLAERLAEIRDGWGER